MFSDWFSFHIVGEFHCWFRKSAHCWYSFRYRSRDMALVFLQNFLLNTVIPEIFLFLFVPRFDMVRALVPSAYIVPAQICCYSASILCSRKSKCQFAWNDEPIYLVIETLYDKAETWNTVLLFNSLGQKQDKFDKILTVWFILVNLLPKTTVNLRKSGLVTIMDECIVKIVQFVKLNVNLRKQFLCPQNWIA